MHEYTNKTNNGVEITDDGIHSLYWFSVAVYTEKIFFFFFEMTTPINAYGGFFWHWHLFSIHSYINIIYFGIVGFKFPNLAYN